MVQHDWLSKHRWYDMDDIIASAQSVELYHFRSTRLDDIPFIGMYLDAAQEKLSEDQRAMNASGNNYYKRTTIADAYAEQHAKQPYSYFAFSCNQ